MPASRFARECRRGFLLILTPLIVSSFPSCKPVKEKNKVQESFVENGVAWAYGSVELAYLDVPAQITVKRRVGAAAPGQTIDSRATYVVYGAVNAAGAQSSQVDLAYVDLHPSQPSMLAYWYSLSYQPRRGRSDMVDVYGVLRKAGRSRPYQKSVYLGAATFRNGHDLATLQLAEGMHLSKIDRGVLQGRWAFHYYAALPSRDRFEGQCPGGVSQMPGQSPGQNPGQSTSCRLLPPTIDLCGGDPTQKDCRPKLPAQQGATVLQSSLGLEVDPEDDLSFITQEKAGKLTFISTIVASSADENLCQTKFFAVARTANGQVNPSCLLKPAPATSQDGKLACGVTVEFQNARTYLERICQIHVTFLEGGEQEIQSAQVLARPE